MYKIETTYDGRFHAYKNGRYGWFEIGTKAPYEQVFTGYKTRRGAMNIIDYDKQVWKKRVEYIY